MQIIVFAVFLIHQDTPCNKLIPRGVTTHVHNKRSDFNRGYFFGDTLYIQCVSKKTEHRFMLAFQISLMHIDEIQIPLTCLCLPWVRNKILKNFRQKEEYIMFIKSYHAISRHFAKVCWVSISNLINCGDAHLPLGKRSSESLFSCSNVFPFSSCYVPQKHFCTHENIN